MSMSDHGTPQGNLGSLFGIGHILESIEQEEMQKAAARVVAGQVDDLWPGEKVTITRNTTEEIPTKGRYTITRTYVEGHDCPPAG